MCRPPCATEPCATPPGQAHFISVGLLSGEGPSTIWNKLSANLLTTLRKNWCFWPIIQLAIYGFVPARHRCAASFPLCSLSPSRSAAGCPAAPRPPRIERFFSAPQPPDDCVGLCVCRLMAVMLFNFLWSIILSSCVNVKAKVTDGDGTYKGKGE